MIACVSALLLGLAFSLALSFAQAPPKKTLKIEEKTATTPQDKTPQEVAEKKTAEEGGVEEKETESYSYDPTNKPDPFKSFIIVKKELEEEKEKEEPRTYLETLDLSQLTVTAIVLSKTKKWALVQDSKGEGHVIEVGTSLGRKRGKVVKIKESEVVVREYNTDYRGNEVINDISLKLPETE
jgi:Tfp pilus assembly protein PilP